LIAENDLLERISLLISSVENQSMSGDVNHNPDDQQYIRERVSEFATKRVLASHGRACYGSTTQRMGHRVLAEASFFQDGSESQVSEKVWGAIESKREHACH